MSQILLVCTGNICRSPLAEALMRRDLARHPELAAEVRSAGTGAWEGAPASEGAYLVAIENGLDLSGHRAQLLTRDLVKGSHVIFTMARHHRARVQELGGEGRTFLLGEYAGLTGPEAEVSDPFGSDIEVYRETYRELERFVARAVERLVAEREDADTRD